MILSDEHDTVGAAGYLPCNPIIRLFIVINNSRLYPHNTINLLQRAK